jgi:hypothetical protein
MTQKEMLLAFFMRATSEMSAHGWTEAAEYFAEMMLLLVVEMEAERQTKIPEGNGSIN